MKPIRIYADTSVFGGVFDPEFREDSMTFFDRVREGKVSLIVSAVVRDEIQDAPPQVRQYFDDISSYAYPAAMSNETNELQEAYLRAGVVSQNSDTDAMHVASATVSECRVIVSWNFKHIVNFRRIQLYNAVNLAQGYDIIAIHSPREFKYDGESGQGI